MTLVLLVYGTLFAACLLAFLLLRSWHRGFAHEIYFGIGALIVAIATEQALLGGLGGWSIERLFELANELPEMLSRWLGVSHTGHTADKFFQEKHFAAGLMNTGLLVSAAVAWGILRLSTQSFAPLPAEEVPALLRGSWQRRFYRSLLLGCALFAIAQVFLLPVGMASDWSFANTVADQLYNGLEGIAWSGPLICMTVLASAARAVSLPQTAFNGRAQEEHSPAAASRIRDMLDYISKTYDGHAIVLLDYDIPSPPAPTAVRLRPTGDGLDPLVDSILRRLGPDASGDAIADLSRAFASFWNDVGEIPGLAAAWRNVLFPEDLQRAHLRVVLEVMRACHDLGGLTLVLAPSRSLPRLREALKQEAGGDRSDFTELWCQPGEQPFATDTEYSALFFSEQSLETELLSQEGAAPRALRRLRMIVSFDFHVIEAALLRLRLRRLADLCHGAPIRVICQSENRSGLQAAVANTFAPLGRAMEPNLVRLGTRQDATRHVVIWMANESTITALASKENVQPIAVGPLEVPPLAALLPLKYGLHSTFPDISNRLDHGSWDRVAQGVRRDIDTLLGLREVEKTAGTFSRSDADCVIVEDTGNVVEALAHARSHAGRSEYVLIIASTRYALRDWMLDLLRSHPAQLRNDSKLPVAADPKGGITELAMVLAGEFRQSNGLVPQRKVAELFHQQQVDAGIARAFGLFPTPKGLGTLFMRETGAKPDISRRTELNHAVTFEIGAHDHPRLAPRLTVQAGQAGFLLAPSDHGLLYAETTTLHRDGQVWSVETVREDRIEVRSVKATESTSRERFHFQRLYNLTFRTATLALDSPARIDRYGPGQRLRLRQLALRGQFKRMTTGFLRLPEAATPFGGGRLPSWSETNILVSQQHAAVLLLRIEQTVMSAEADQQRDRMQNAAFTLAATLQDVLASLFPLYRHRITVVSPQSGPMLAGILNAAVGSHQEDLASEVNRFPVDLYPRLVARSAIPANDRPASRDAMPINVTDAEAEISAFLDEVDPRSDAADNTGSRCYLDLIVIEDANHDLGLVHALNSRGVRDRALAVWRDFLFWLSQPERGTQPGFFYAFGAGQLPSCFDFAGALAIVDNLIGNPGAGGGS